MTPAEREVQDAVTDLRFCQQDLKDARQRGAVISMEIAEQFVGKALDRLWGAQHRVEMEKPGRLITVREHWFTGTEVVR